MKKIMLSLMVGVLLVSLAACGSGGKYGEVRDTMVDMMDVMNSFGDAVASAKDGEDVADAVSDFVDEFVGIKEKIKELEDKFPDFDLGKRLPEELKDLKPKIEASIMKLFGALMKVEKFKRDPELKKIEDKLEKLNDLGRGLL